MTSQCQQACKFQTYFFFNLFNCFSSINFEQYSDCQSLLQLAWWNLSIRIDFWDFIWKNLVERIHLPFPNEFSQHSHLKIIIVCSIKRYWQEIIQCNLLIVLSSAKLSTATLLHRTSKFGFANTTLTNSRLSNLI